MSFAGIGIWTRSFLRYCKVLKYVLFKMHNEIRKSHTVRNIFVSKVRKVQNLIPYIKILISIHPICRVTAVSVCEDSSLLSAGFSDSTIRVFTLTPNKLRSMKSPEELELIDKDTGKILVLLLLL